MAEYIVCYLVRYGPSGSGASWMEESHVIEADSPRKAQQEFRRKHHRGRTPFYYHGYQEVGRHISTRLTRRR